VFVCVLLGDGRQLLCSGGVSFGVRSRAQQWGGFSLGSVFQKRIIFGGAEIAQPRPAESMAGETSSRLTNADFEIL
jgi:hypothetical protein